MLTELEDMFTSLLLFLVGKFIMMMK